MLGLVGVVIRGTRSPIVVASRRSESGIGVHVAGCGGHRISVASVSFVVLDGSVLLRLLLAASSEDCEHRANDEPSRLHEIEANALQRRGRGAADGDGQKGASKAAFGSKTSWAAVIFSDSERVPVVKRTSRRSPEPQVRVRLPAGAPVSTMEAREASSLMPRSRTCLPGGHWPKPVICQQ